MLYHVGRHRHRLHASLFGHRCSSDCLREAWLLLKCGGADDCGEAADEAMGQPCGLGRRGAATLTEGDGVVVRWQCEACLDRALASLDSTA
jgi:hypothetical protein